jgi:hypothetical protein
LRGKRGNLGLEFSCPCSLGSRVEDNEALIHTSLSE